MTSYAGVAYRYRGCSRKQLRHCADHCGADVGHRGVAQLVVDWRNVRSVGKHLQDKQRSLLRRRKLTFAYFMCRFLLGMRTLSIRRNPWSLKLMPIFGPISPSVIPKAVVPSHLKSSGSYGRNCHRKNDTKFHGEFDMLVLHLCFPFLLQDLPNRWKILMEDRLFSWKAMILASKAYPLVVHAFANPESAARRDAVRSISRRYIAAPPPLRGWRTCPCCPATTWWR